MDLKNVRVQDLKESSGREEHAGYRVLNFCQCETQLREK